MSRWSMCSRRRGAAWLLAGIAILVLGGLVGACARPTPSRGDLTEALQRSGYTRAESTCIADAYLRNLDDDQLREVAERGGAGVPAEVAPVLSGTLANCAPSDAADPAATTTTAPPSTTTPSTTTRPAAEAASSTTLLEGGGGSSTTSRAGGESSATDATAGAGG